MEGWSSAERLSSLTEAFDRAGGRGSKVLIRRVWLGAVQADLVRRQRAVYDSYSGTTIAFGDDQTVASNDPAEVVARLCHLIETTRSTALNVRVHLPGMPPEAIRQQIEALGTEVIGPLKERWPTF